MKRNALAAAAAFLLLGSVQAQMVRPPANPWYGELGYTFLKIDAGGDSARPGAIRGIIGYDFHPYFAVEGMLGGGVNDDDTIGVINGVSANLAVENKSMYGLFIKPKYLWNQFEFFGRFGYAHTKVSLESRTAGVASSTQSDDAFAWGVGANWRLTQFWYTGIDWMRYSNQSGHKVDGLTLSAGFRW
jgi:opacity protein-like surface antigen